MTRTPTALNRLIIALVFATQLFLLAPATQASGNTIPTPPQNTNTAGRDRMPANENRALPANFKRRRARSRAACRTRCKLRNCNFIRNRAERVRCYERQAACLGQCG